ncbi:MAG: type II toxin-antitoxin system HicA family toxin [Candidatus Liptonbacteria bacterium]|nr:type II toxin-antitoxin system HicA family toxin [Candidatus Liptonbacteria bacterium]
MGSKLCPVAWREFVRKMKRSGFDGPNQEGKHPYLVRGGLVLTIPNRHDGDISVDLLKRILKQVGISREEWLCGNKS